MLAGAADLSPANILSQQAMPGTDLSPREQRYQTAAARAAATPVQFQMLREVTEREEAKRHSPEKVRTRGP